MIKNIKKEGFNSAMSKQGINLRCFGKLIHEGFLVILLLVFILLSFHFLLKI